MGFGVELRALGSLARSLGGPDERTGGGGAKWSRIERGG